MLAELSVRASALLNVRVSVRFAVVASAAPWEARPGRVGGAKRSGEGRGARGGRPPGEEAGELREKRKGGFPAGQRGDEEADHTGCVGCGAAPGRRGAAGHDGHGSQGLGHGSAAPAGEYQKARGGGRRGPGCAGDGGGGRAVRRLRPGGRRPWVGGPAWDGVRTTSPLPGGCVALRGGVRGGPSPGQPWRRSANGDPSPEDRPPNHPASRVDVLDRG